MDMNNVVKKILEDPRNIEKDRALKEDLKSSMASWDSKKQQQYKRATSNSYKVEKEIENNFGK